MKPTLSQLIQQWKAEREMTEIPDSLTAGPDCITFPEAESALNSAESISDERRVHAASCPYCLRLIRLFEAEAQQSRSLPRTSSRVSGVIRWRWASTVLIAVVIIALIPGIPFLKIFVTPKPTSPELIAWTGLIGTPRGDVTHWRRLDEAGWSVTSSGGVFIDWDQQKDAVRYRLTIREVGKPPFEPWVFPAQVNGFTAPVGMLKPGERYEYLVEYQIKSP